MEIKNGFVQIYYCFDVGESIDINRLEYVFGDQAEKSLIICKRLTPPYIQYKTPPLFIREGEKKIKIGAEEINSTIDIKIYNFGVVTIRISIPLRCNIDELVEMSNLIVGNEEIRNLSISQLNKIIEKIHFAISQPQKNPSDEWEDYYIYLLHEIDEETLLLEKYRNQIAMILRSEKEMSQFEIEDALKYKLSYHANDLTIIDWNSSFIYDPEKSYDIQDIIEFAVIQLLELRLYDSILDSVIEQAYNDIGEHTSKKFKLFPFSSPIDKLSEIKLDISEIIDRIENYLKLIGDLYLAKVYAVAYSRFYLDKWKSAVRDKLNTIESLYSKAWEHSQTRKMVIAEIAIVILFILDVILIFYGLLK